MWRVVQAAELITIKQESRLIVREREGIEKTIVLLSHEFPEMQVVLGPDYLFCVSPSRISQREEVKQPVVDQP